MTLPITIASAERSFSKLKIIKNYLRTTMMQDRLSDLAIISIEHDLCENVDYNNIIEKFTKIKSRKVNFRWMKLFFTTIFSIFISVYFYFI